MAISIWHFDANPVSGVYVAASGDLTLRIQFDVGTSNAVDTVTKKFGAASYQAAPENAYGDHHIVYTDEAVTYGDDYTVSLWLYFGGSNSPWAYCPILYGAHELRVGNSGNLLLYISVDDGYNTTVNLSGGAGTITTGWHYISICRNADVVYLHVDGVLIDSETWSTAADINVPGSDMISAQITLGYTGDGYWFNPLNRVDELYINPTQALYSAASYTPPTSAWPDPPTVLTAPISVTSTDVVASLSAPLAVTSADVVTSLAAPLAVTSYAPPYELDDGLWAIEATLDGEDITDRLTDTCKITITAGAARVADLAWLPESGAIDPTALAGQTLTIDLLLGQAQDRYRRFTGRIAQPVINLDTGVVRLTASDGRQAALDALSRSALDALTPDALWSPFTGDPLSWGDVYLRERLLTWPGEVDMDEEGDLRATAWHDGPTLYRTLGLSDIIDGSLSYELAGTDRRINEVEAVFDYRYQWAKVRRANYVWDVEDLPTGGYSVGPGSILPATLPTRDGIASAAEGEGWKVGSGSTYTGLCARWPTGSYPGPIAWVCAAPTSMVACNLRLDRRYSQTITETYTITVQASASITQAGTLKRQDKYSGSAEFDAAAWAADASLAPVLAASGSTGEVQAEATTSSEDGRAIADDALACILAMGRTTILASHRANTVTCSLPVDPLMDTTRRLRIETPNLEAEGKIDVIVESYDFAAGSAISTVTFRVSGCAGTQPTSDTLTPPAAPSKPSPTLTGLSVTGITQLHTAGRQDAPLDDDASGWLYNAVGGAIATRYAITTPAIPDDDTQPITLTASATYDTAIPADDFSLTI